MKRFICLQAGHQNAKNNCDARLARGTGAPGEAEFTVRVRDRVSQILLSKKNKDGSEAFMVQLVDATYNCDPNASKNDYALFLSIHYDADIYNTGGGFADFPEPSTDHATKESQRITKVFNEEYFKHSGIKYVNRSNANTRYYYMWKFLSAKTPCVILEAGVGKDEHDSVILADTERVANAIVRSICTVFNVPFEDTPPAEDKDEKIKELDKEVKKLEGDISRHKERVISGLGKIDGLLNQAKGTINDIKNNV